MTSRYHGSKISWSQLKGSLSNHAFDGKENWKKAIGLYHQNNNSARASLFFVRFSAVVTRLRRETSYFYAPALRRRWAQRENFLFLFLNIDTVLSNLTPEISPTFDKLNEIEWDRRSSKQCEFTFLVMFSVCCHPEIFLPLQSDVTTSPPYNKTRPRCLGVSWYEETL